MKTRAQRWVAWSEESVSALMSNNLTVFVVISLLIFLAILLFIDRLFWGVWHSHKRKILGLSAIFLIVVFFILLINVLLGPTRPRLYSHYLQHTNLYAPLIQLKIDNIGMEHANLSLNGSILFPKVYEEDGLPGRVCFDNLTIYTPQIFPSDSRNYYSIPNNSPFDLPSAELSLSLLAIKKLRNNCHVFGYSGGGTRRRGYSDFSWSDLLTTDLPLKYSRSSYFYPFDQASIEIYTLIDQELTYENQATVSSTDIGHHVNLVVDTNKWDYSVESDELDNNGALVLRINLQRPFPVKLLTTLLLVTAFFFIISLIRIKENSSFLEVSVGVLLGLWSLQELLIPDYLNEPTIVNNFILVLYLLLALISILRYFLILSYGNSNSN